MVFLLPGWLKFYYNAHWLTLVKIIGTNKSAVEDVCYLDCLVSLRTSPFLKTHGVLKTLAEQTS